MALVPRTLAIGLAVALYCAESTAQQSYPAKPIRFLVPYSNGGFADTLGRSLGQYFQEKMGQPVIIDNRPAAGQAVALEMAARAAPDG